MEKALTNSISSKTFKTMKDFLLMPLGNTTSFIQ